MILRIAILALSLLAVAVRAAPFADIDRAAVASGDTREWDVEALRYDADGGYDDWSVVLDGTGTGDGRLPTFGAAQVVPFLQHTPPQRYDPDYYQTRQQPLRIEIEELTE